MIHCLKQFCFQLTTETCQDIRVLTDSQFLVRHLSAGPARQKDSVSCSIRALLSSASKTNAVTFQWIPGHVGLEGNERADMEAKLGCTKSQPVIAIDCYCLLHPHQVCSRCNCKTIPLQQYLDVCTVDFCACMCVCAVSYTHLTLPTNREV